MKIKKNRYNLSAKVLILLIIIASACQILLETSPKQEDEPMKKITFVGKNKSLNSANVQIYNQNGDKILENNLNANGDLETFPSKGVFLKFNQKESENGL